MASDSRLTYDGGCANLVPDDTQLYAKWWPTIVSDGEENYEEWQKVLAQISPYIAYHRARYGFIVTDQFAVALRLTCYPISSGRAAVRPRRATTTCHQRHVSDTSMTSIGGSSFNDDNPGQWEYYNPEYAVAPRKGTRKTADGRAYPLVLGHDGRKRRQFSRVRILP